MITILSLLLLGTAPELTKVDDQLFHHSDVQGAVRAIDQFLANHPDDPEALDRAVIAHAAVDDAHQVNALAARRAALGDARALPTLLFAWEAAHTSHEDAVLLLGGAKKILPKMTVAEAAPVRRLIGQLDRILGRFEDAVADARLPGQIVDWQIIGPFENEQNLGFQKVYPPEEGIDLTATYPGKVGDVHWRPFGTVNWDGTLCLACTEFPRESGVSYLVTWVRTTNDADAAIWAEATNHIKIWVNHRLATSDDRTRREADGQVRAGLRLHAGWNEVVIKSAQQGRNWSAGLRLTDSRGAPLEGLEVSAQAHPTKVATEGEHWPKPPEDPIIAMLAKDKSVLPGSYLKPWRLFSQGEARAALNSFEILVLRGPACAVCSYGVAVSSLWDEYPDGAVTALRAAVDEDRGFSGAVVERGRLHHRMSLDEQAERDAKAATESNPADPEALALLAELRLKHGYHAEAARLAAAAAEHHPGWGRYADLRAAAALAEGDRSLAESLLRAAFADDPASAPEALFMLLKTDGRLDAAAKLFQGWLAHDPQATGVRAALAEVLIDAHEDARARLELAELRRLEPEAPVADRLEGDLDERRGDRAAAIAAYRKALARSPADWGLREHLEFLDPSTQVAKAYQVTEDEVRKRAQRTEKPVAGNAVVLLNERTFVAHEDGSIRFRHHFAVKVFDQAGIEMYLNHQVGTDPSLRLELAATFDKEGGIHEVSSLDKGVVHFANPGKGATFEIIYSGDTKPRPGTDWWTAWLFQEAQPSLEQRWIVVQPKGRSLRTWKRGKAIEEKHESLDGAEVTVFDARNTPALMDEPDHPPLSSFGDLAVVSTFKDWEAVAQFVRGTVDDQLALDIKDPEIVALAHNLTSRAKTLDQKVAALAGYVRREIHYNRAGTDVYTWRAHIARNIVETRYGDCKDKATLFEALAQNVGLQTEHAVLLVNPEGTTPIEIPTLWFDHAVAYLPPQPGLTQPGLLDLTANESGTGVVPFMDQNANALVFKPKGSGSRLERIPFSPPRDTRRQLTLKLQVQPSGSASGTVEAHLSGLAAAGFRTRYRHVGERQAFLDHFANFALSDASRVGKETVSGLDDPEKDIDLKLGVDTGVLLRRMGDAQLLKLSDLARDLEPYIRQTAREEPLRLGPETDNEVHRVIVLPKDLSAARLPDAVHLDNPFFAFDLTAKRIDDRTIAVDTHYQRKVAEIPHDQFQAFKKSADEVAHAADVDVLLRSGSQAKLGSL